MKMYKKEDLSYKNGLIVAPDGEVVAIDNEVVDMANELETRIQKADYLKAQPEPVAIPTLDGFVRQTETTITSFTCDTPLMDERVEKSIDLMNEIDNKTMTDKLNNQLELLTPLVCFVKDDELLSVENNSQHRFDVPVMGNPLVWTEEDLMEFVCRANGVEVEVDEYPVINEVTDDDPLACFGKGIKNYKE